MRVNSNDYRLSKSGIIKTLKRQGIAKMNELCAVLGVPIIVVCKYCIEESFGDKEYLEDKIERLIKFYGYTEIK